MSLLLAFANVEGRFSVRRNRFSRLAREGRCQDSRVGAEILSIPTADLVRLLRDPRSSSADIGSRRAQCLPPFAIPLIFSGGPSFPRTLAQKSTGATTMYRARAFSSCHPALPLSHPCDWCLAIAVWWRTVPSVVPSIFQGEVLSLGGVPSSATLQGRFNSPVPQQPWLLLRC